MYVINGGGGGGWRVEKNGNGKNGKGNKGNGKNGNGNKGNGKNGDIFVFVIINILSNYLYYSKKYYWCLN